MIERFEISLAFSLAFRYYYYINHVFVIACDGFPCVVSDGGHTLLLQDCKVERKDSHVTGTLVFNEVFSAKHAVRCISGCEFDENVTLTARVVGEEALDQSTGEQPGEASLQPNNNHQHDVNVAMNGNGVVMDQMDAQQQQQQQVPIFPGGPAYAFAPGAAVVAPQLQFRPVGGGKGEKDNPPCNTLFIGNLTEGVSEDELNHVFGKQPGFQQLKIARTSKGISAFIEFADTKSAIECHKQHQGLVLESSDRGAIRVQFSKNPFGYKQKQSPRIPSNGNMAVGARMAVHPGYAPAYAMPPMAAPAAFPSAPQPLYPGPAMPGFTGQQQQQQ